MTPPFFSQSPNARWASARRNAIPATLLCGAFLLLVTADASAAVRFAAPGGAAPASSECLKANPCSLFNAASRTAQPTALAPGDEIVIEPGAYSDAAGDLGLEGTIFALGGTTIHGAANAPRPVITIGVGLGAAAFFIDGNGTVLSHVEIVGANESRAYLLRSESIVDGVIARTGDRLALCRQTRGLIRDSVCLSSGDNGTALEVEENLSPNNTARLRNVTAIASGANSVGLFVRGTGNLALTVDAVGVLARGSRADVFTRALTGARVAVSLGHSDFVDIPTETAGGGTATVTEPGSGTNITDEPLLAADGYHQLPGSLTIDAGATDQFSGTADVDRESRVFGAAADIGADEHHPPAAEAPPSPAPPPRPNTATQPNTVLKQKPARRTKSRRATFTFASSQAGSRFECKLDKKAFKSCRSPFKVKGLRRGRHSFQVRAVGPGGARDSTPAVFRWTVT